MTTKAINWFGIEEKKKKKNKGKSNPLMVVKTKKYKVTSVPLFPGLIQRRKKQAPMSFMKPVKMNPSFNRAKTSFKSSEELLYSKKRLRLFGDTDMDGSPNKFDCNPWRVDRDGFLSNLLRRRKEAKVLKRKSASEIAEEPEQYALQKAISEKKKRAETKKGIKEARALMKEEGVKMSAGKTKKAIEEAQKLAEKITEAREKLEEREQFKEGGRYYGKLGKVRLKQQKIKEKIERGEKPSTEELEQVEKTEETYKQSHPLYALSKGELPSVKAIKTAARGAEWSKEASSFGKSTTKMAAGILGAFLPSETFSTRSLRSGRSKGSAGRPKGSFTHVIPGVGPVDVYTYRKWARKQKSIARLKGELPEQQIDLQQLQEPPAVIEETEVPTVYTGEEQAQVESLPIQPRRPVVQATVPQFVDTRQVAQYNEQKSDIILNAPNILKGEMVGTGQHGFTYTPPEQNILNAPNAFLGQLRNIGQTGEVPAVRLSEKPIPNPYGDQYTEVDPITGKTVLRTRKSEKWSTGEAY